MRIRIKGENFIAMSEVLLVLYLCLPITISLLNSMLIRILVFSAALLFLLGMMLKNAWRNLIEFTLLFSVTLLLWYVVWRHQLDSLSYIYYCFASLSFVYGGVVIYNSKDLKLARKLFTFITVVYTVTAITTIRGLAIYPLAAREMARGSSYDQSLDFDAYKEIYRRMNIAGWSQIYGMLFQIPGLCILWKKTKKLHWLGMALLMVMAIIMAQITFAAILGLAFLVGILIIGKDNAKTIIFLMLGFVVAVFVLIDLDNILGLIIDASENIGFDFLRVKLNDMRQLLINKKAVGDAGSRFDLYMTSIKSFFDSPIVGQIFNNNVTQDIVGRHSEVFDLVAATGLIGVIFVVHSISRYVGFIRSNRTEFKKELMIAFIGFVVVAAINPVFSSPQIFLSMFVYTLLSIKLCSTVFLNR